mgnify:CR=1 FL=1
MQRVQHQRHTHKVVGREDGQVVLEPAAQVGEGGRATQVRQSMRVVVEGGQAGRSSLNLQSAVCKARGERVALAQADWGRTERAEAREEREGLPSNLQRQEGERRHRWRTT